MGEVVLEMQVSIPDLARGLSIARAIMGVHGSALSSGTDRNSVEGYLESSAEGPRQEWKWDLKKGTGGGQ